MKDCRYNLGVAMSEQLYAKLIIVGLVCSFLFQGCATTTDPREGGLAGGIHGLSTGKYEKRIQQREERLNKLKQIQKDLEEEQAALAAEKEIKAAKLAEQKRELETLLAARSHKRQIVTKVPRSKLYGRKSH